MITLRKFGLRSARVFFFTSLALASVIQLTGCTGSKTAVVTDTDTQSGDPDELGTNTATSTTSSTSTSTTISKIFDKDLSPAEAGAGGANGQQPLPSPSQRSQYCWGNNMGLSYGTAQGQQGNQSLGAANYNQYQDATAACFQPNYRGDWRWNDDMFYNAGIQSYNLMDQCYQAVASRRPQYGASREEIRFAFMQAKRALIRCHRMLIAGHQQWAPWDTEPQRGFQYIDDRLLSLFGTLRLGQ